MNQNSNQMQPVINTQAAQDILIQSGFLNHFKWSNPNKKSAWVYLNRSDGKDQQGKTEYRSIMCQVFGNAARMLESYHTQMQQAKQQGQRMSVLVQVYSGFVTSFKPQNNQGAPSNPVTIMKCFKACIVNSSDRMIMDVSEDQRWNAPMGQQGGQQNYAPQNQGNYQKQGGQQNYAPQNQGNYQQQGGQQHQNGGYQAPAQPQQPAPMAEPDFDFDDDIPF